MNKKAFAWFAVLWLTAAAMTVPVQGPGNLIGVGIALYALGKFWGNRLWWRRRKHQAPDKQR